MSTWASHNGDEEAFLTGVAEASQPSRAATCAISLWTKRNSCRSRWI